MKTEIGFCRFCQDQKIVEVPDDATEEMINEEATRTCNCYEARDAREKKYQKGACIANIEEMIKEKHPEIADLLESSIDPIQEGKISKITVNTPYNQTIRLSRCKDGIKVELEKKTKEESLA